MNKTFNLQKNLIIFGIPLFIIGIMVLLVKSPVFNAHRSSLSIGITFDLLLTVPLVYFLLIRKTNIPKTTAVPFLIIGLLIGSFILPAENQNYLDLFKTWVLPIVELSILLFAIYHLRKGIKHYTIHKNQSFDFYTTLKQTCYKILPKSAVIPVVTEIAVFYYGFIYWKKRKLASNEFTYHKESGTLTLLIALINIIAIETVVFHILLMKWSNLAAWILTSISIYSGIQILGFLKSMLKRPISIENNMLYLRYGIMTESTIDLDSIDSIELSSKDIEGDDMTRRLSFLGEMETHNVIIHLKEENTLVGLYGIRRKYKTLALHIDNKVAFKDCIDQVLQ